MRLIAYPRVDCIDVSCRTQASPRCKAHPEVPNIKDGWTIFEHAVGPDDVNVTIYSRSEVWRYPASRYHRIPERTWGKLTEDSPTAGLCTDLVDTCLVFICHCKATRRTTMMHTPSTLDIQVIEDQLEYVTNGASLRVELVVLKGASYSERKKRELTDDVQRCVADDLAWLDQFIQDVRARARKLSLPLTVTRPSRCLEHGCMLVDKKTGKITVPVPANGFEPTKYLYVGLPEPMSESQFLQIGAQDQFYRISSTSHAIALQQYGFAFAYPCYLEYDGTSTTLPPRMSDFARTIFQYFVLYGPIPSGIAIPVSEKLSVTISEELRGYINDHPLREQGMFCEICQQPAKSTCNSCRTAWYCCRDHQTSDWKNHRFWCKSHRVISAVSTPRKRNSSLESQSSTQFSEANTSLSSTQFSEVQHEDKIVSDKAKTADDVDSAITAVNTEENSSGSLDEESTGSQTEAQIVSETEPIEEAKTQDDLGVAVEGDSDHVDDTTPEALMPRLSNSPSTLSRIHSKLSKTLKIFYSWKFYFCIFSVIVAYIVRIYHMDLHILHINYPISW